MDKVFYYFEWTEILNKLLPKIPIHQDFDLYQIAQEAKISYEELFTDSFANVEQTYIQISNGLIANGFAELVSGHKIKLTEEGIRLQKAGNWMKYQKRLKLEQQASYWDTFMKAKWLHLAIIGFIFSNIIGVVIAEYLKEALVKKKREKPSQHIIIIQDSCFPHKIDTFYLNQKSHTILK